MKLLSTALVLATAATALPAPSSWRTKLPFSDLRATLFSSSSHSAEKNGDELPSLTSEDWASIQKIAGGGSSHQTSFQEHANEKEDASSWLASKLLPLTGGALASSPNGLLNMLENALQNAGPVIQDDNGEKTIWQVLNDDADKKYTKIIKLIEFEGGHAKKYLDDKDASITFFAPNNDAIPDHDHDHDHPDDDDDDEEIDNALTDVSLWPDFSSQFSFPFLSRLLRLTC